MALFSTQPAPEVADQEANSSLVKSSFEILKYDFGITETSYKEERTYQYFADKDGQLQSDVFQGVTLEIYSRKTIIHKLELKKDNSILAHDMLSDDVLEAFVNKGVLPDINYNSVARRLFDMGIKAPYVCLGKVDTFRWGANHGVAEWDGVEIILEEAHYPNKQIKYEIKIFSDDEKKNKDILSLVLAGRSISVKPSKSRTEIFFEILETVK